MATIVETLTDYALPLRFEHLPPDVVHQAKRLLIDTLGCAIGGFGGEPSVVARALAESVSSRQPATVLGTGRETSPDLATFANGVMIRYLDFNDGYTSQESGHPSDAIAAVLSPAEIVHGDGRSVITATVLAYEVFCRLCDAVSVRARGFDHVTHGVVASTAGAAKAMGLSRAQTIQALNMSVAANSALYQTRIGDVSLWKGCAFANASRNAVFAAMLAAQGLTGPSPIFEGPGGFFNAVSRGPFALAPFGGDRDEALRAGVLARSRATRAGGEGEGHRLRRGESPGARGHAERGRDRDRRGRARHRHRSVSPRPLEESHDRRGDRSQVPRAGR